MDDLKRDAESTPGGHGELDRYQYPYLYPYPYPYPYPYLYPYPLQIPGEQAVARLPARSLGKRHQARFHEFGPATNALARILRLTDRARGLRPLGSQRRNVGMSPMNSSVAYCPGLPTALACVGVTVLLAGARGLIPATDSMVFARIAERLSAGKTHSAKFGCIAPLTGLVPVSTSIGPSTGRIPLPGHKRSSFSRIRTNEKIAGSGVSGCTTAPGSYSPRDF